MITGRTCVFGNSEWGLHSKCRSCSPKWIWRKRIESLWGRGCPQPRRGCDQTKRDFRHHLAFVDDRVLDDQSFDIRGNEASILLPKIWDGVELETFSNTATKNSHFYSTREFRCQTKSQGVSSWRRLIRRERNLTGLSVLDLHGSTVGLWR